MEELYEEYSKIVYHFLCSLCRDAMLAEELTQETFLQAFLSLERYDGGCKLSVWLCQIAKLLRLFGYGLHKAIYGLTLTGVALASGFLCILGNLATVEAFYEMLAKMLVCVVLEGVLCSVILCRIVKN